MNLEEGQKCLFTKKKKKKTGLPLVRLGILGKEIFGPPLRLDKIMLLNQICSGRRVRYSKLKFQIQLCGGMLVLLIWEEVKRGAGIVWPVWIVHMASTVSQVLWDAGKDFRRIRKFTAQEYQNYKAAAIQTQSNSEVLSCCFHLLVIVHLFHRYLWNAIYDGKYWKARKYK